jgi:ABC-type uncharacterized transport system substrate-binding protein
MMAGISFRKILLVRILTLMAILCTAWDVGAHPHIWIDAVATFVFDRGKVAALMFEWTFDEFYSDVLLDKFDANKDRKFDEKEIREIQAQAFANLKDSNYFTYVRIGGRSVPTREISGFSAASVKGRVVFRFTLGLPSPVDPVATPILLSVYDETFFVEIKFDDLIPVRFDGKRDSKCDFDIREDKNTPLYFGMIFPQQIRLLCKRP